MSGRSIDFFADPEEQVQFLTEVLRLSGSYALLDKRSEDTDRFQRVEHPGTLQFISDGRFPWALHLFHESIAPSPVWLEQGHTGRKDLDFYRSGCILFDPALRVGDTILMGRFAVGSKHLYEEQGVDLPRVTRWYTRVKRVAQDLLSHQAAWAVSATGVEVLQKGIWVSRGAVRSAASGISLKQVLTGTVHFRPTDPMV